jgi:hypothetical protein
VSVASLMNSTGVCAAPEAAVAECMAALEAEAGSQDETERRNGGGSDGGS